MRHTGMYVVELGVGIGKGERCRRKKGKRIVEERRGRICEGNYPCTVEVKITCRFSHRRTIVLLSNRHRSSPVVLLCF